MDIPCNLPYYLQSPMNVFHSPNSAHNSKHILPTTSDVPLNGTDTFISNNSQTIMTRLNNSTDSHANSSSSVPFCNSPTELFINVSSSCPPRLTTTTKKTMYVRALFDYDPNMDTGLPGRVSTYLTFTNNFHDYGFLKFCLCNIISLLLLLLLLLCCFFKTIHCTHIYTLLSVLL